MQRDEAFTLVELLVVIAIISILAGIVVPRVTAWVSRGRETEAISEIKNVELALTAVLTDANKRHFGQFFNHNFENKNGDRWGDLWIDRTLAATVQYQTDVFYRLLRRGREARVPLLNDVRKKLAVSYMDLGTDAWGDLYQIYAGPWREEYVKDPDDGFEDLQLLFTDASSGFGFKNPFRARDADTYYDVNKDLERLIPGTITDEATGIGKRRDGTRIHGFPADMNLPFYIFSKGQNLRVDQFFGPEYIEFDGEDFFVLEKEFRDREYLGGGDDVNNWDKTQSWSGFYR